MMTITLRGTSRHRYMFRFMGRLPFVALALGLAVPFAGSLHAQSAAKPGASTDSEARLRKVEAEIRAIQRKVFPDGGGKMFAPEITPGQAVIAPAGSPAAPAVTDLLARMDAVEAQLTRLTAQVEEGQNRAARMEERLAKLEADVPAAPQPAAAPPPCGCRCCTCQACSRNTCHAQAGHDSREASFTLCSAGCGGSGD